jgi:hypothetical protein
MKLKLTLTIFSLLIFNAYSFAQLSTLINNFKPAYTSSDVSNYVYNGEEIVANLKPEEKAKGERILTLFKVLTGKEQDMTTVNFNKAIYEVGLSALLEKNINSDLSLISIRSGAYRSYLIFNSSKKSYKFSLQGLFKTSSNKAKQNFDGGVFDYHCRIVAYTTTPYVYTATSVTELPSVF